MGILGFLLDSVLNESKRIDGHARAGSVGLFGLVFAVATGALWEIFEFAVNQLFGTRMQTRMFDESPNKAPPSPDIPAETMPTRGGAAAIHRFK